MPLLFNRSPTSSQFVFREQDERSSLGSFQNSMNSGHNEVHYSFQPSRQIVIVSEGNQWTRGETDNDNNKLTNLRLLPIPSSISCPTI